jgi:hypothetical protein
MYFNQNESAILELIDAFTLGKIAARILSKDILPHGEPTGIHLIQKYRHSHSAFFDGVFTLVDSYCSTPG